MSASNYARAVRAIQPAVNHARIPDDARRYAVTLNGETFCTDSPSRVARAVAKGATVADRVEDAA